MWGGASEGMHRSLLVGCGSRGSRHAGALARREEFEFAAVCDIDRERAGAVADEHDVPRVFEELTTALAAVEPTHVTAVFPPSVRLPVYREVLGAAPASMVVEKPVANTREEARRFRALAAETATTVTVCHQHIYTAEARALKRWLAAGRLGDLRRVTASSRGYVLSNGSHLVHMVNWLLGATPERVRGFVEGPALMQRRTTAEPEGALLAARYPSGVRATVDAGEAAPGVAGEESRWLETRLEVTGTAGRAELTLTDGAELVAADGRERVPARAAATDWFGDREWEKWDYLEGYATDGLYADHARALAGDGEHPGALDRAVAAQRVIEAGFRSALEGRGVAPAADPPAIGVSTEKRLRRSLSGRRPLVVATAPFEAHPCGAVLDALAADGFTDVALDVAHLGDGDAVADRPVAVHAVTVAADGPTERAASAAAEFGATLVVDGVTNTAGWSDPVPETVDEVALAPADPTGGDGLAELAATVDADICLSPASVLAAGDAPAGVLDRLGDAVGALLLRDAEPGLTDPAAGPPASAVPGGGGGVDFRALLAAAADAPGAHWIHRPPTEMDPAAAGESLRRTARYIEARRPTGYSSR